MNAPFERKDVVRVTPVFCIWSILTICLRSELQTQLFVISTAEGGPRDDEPESSRGHLPKVCGPNERHKKRGSPDFSKCEYKSSRNKWLSDQNAYKFCS